MKLQVCGTSTSTYREEQVIFVLMACNRDQECVCNNKEGCETYFAGDFVAAFVFSGSIHAVNGFSFIVIHISAEVFESFGH